MQTVWQTYPALRQALIHSISHKTRELTATLSRATVDFRCSERFNYLDKVDDFHDQTLWNDANWLVVPDMEYGVEPEVRRSFGFSEEV